MGGLVVFDKMDPDFLERLDDLRDTVGIPFVITSSWRSPHYNQSIGGAPKSKHLDGIAVDIACTDGHDRLEIVDTALMLGFTIGVGKTFLHLDTRDDQIIFGY